MSPDNLVLLYAALGLFITTSLILLNNIRQDAEKRMEEPIDFVSYLKKKAKGDVVDRLIAEQLEVEDVAA